MLRKPSAQRRADPPPAEVIPDREADVALAAVSVLARDLVAGERWTGERGEYLVAAVRACGPEPPRRSPERALRAARRAQSSVVSDDRGQP